MSKRPLVIFGIFAAICVVLLPFWAIEKEGGADAAPQAVSAADKPGEELFQINCGACHTLAAAGTDGAIGPNLDTLLGTGTPSPDTIKANSARVLSAVDQGIGGRMPAGILEGDQAQQVADFVGANVQYLPSTGATAGQ